MGNSSLNVVMRVMWIECLLSSKSTFILPGRIPRHFLVTIRQFAIFIFFMTTYLSAKLSLNNDVAPHAKALARNKAVYAGVSGLAEKIALSGVSVEQKFAGLGWLEPPSIYFHSPLLANAYRIQLACVLANARGAGWSMNSFFAPMGGISIRTPNREPGQLRFLVTVGASDQTLFQRVKDHFHAYDFAMEISCLSQCLTEVNTPGWRPSSELVDRGFVM